MPPGGCAKLFAHRIRLDYVMLYCIMLDLDTIDYVRQLNVIRSNMRYSCMPLASAARRIRLYMCAYIYIYVLCIIWSIMIHTIDDL